MCEIFSKVERLVTSTALETAATDSSDISSSLDCEVVQAGNAEGSIASPGCFVFDGTESVGMNGCIATMTATPTPNAPATMQLELAPTVFLFRSMNRNRDPESIFNQVITFNYLNYVFV